jgi:mono/diheme cytochrome c family protein
MRPTKERLEELRRTFSFLRDRLDIEESTPLDAIREDFGSLLAEIDALTGEVREAGEVLAAADAAVSPRVLALATRLVAAGPKAARVSCSECHEITDAVHDLSAILARSRSLRGGG